MSRAVLHQPSVVRPGEQLEARVVPAIRLTLAGGIAGTLSLTEQGTSLSDAISISQSGNDALVTLGSGQVFDTNSTTSVVIEYRTVNNTITSPTNKNAVEARIFGAAGIGADLAVDITTGDGDDQLTLTTATVNPLRFNALTTDMGDGTDVVTFGAFNMNIAGFAGGSQNLTVQSETIQQNPGSSGVLISGFSSFSNQAGTGKVDFPVATNRFTGTVSAFATGNAVTLNAAADLTYRTIIAASLTSSVTGASNIQQSAASILSVTNVGDLTTATGNITLDKANNNFGQLRLTGANATIVEINGFDFTTVGALGTQITGDLIATSQSITIAGAVDAKNLTLTTTNGNIDDGGSGGPITVSGSSTFTTPLSRNINLSRRHTLHGATGSATVTRTGNLTISTLGDLTADFPNVGGILTVNSGGNFTKSAMGSIQVTGAASLTAVGDITLAPNNVDFNNTLSIFAGGNVLIRDTDELSLNTSAVTGSLDVGINKAGTASLNNQMQVIGNITAGTISLSVDETDMATTTDHLILNAVTLQSTTGGISLSSGDDIQLNVNSRLFSASGLQPISFNVDAGSNDSAGSVFTLIGSIQASLVNATSGPDNDTLNLTLLTTAPANLSGGDGDDILLGGDQSDIIDGGTGNDSLSGSSGRDQLTGGDDDDTLRSGISEDTVFFETLDAGPGADVVLIDYQGGKFNVNSGDDDDSIVISDTGNGIFGTVIVNGGNGADVISAAPLKNAAVNIMGGDPTTLPGDSLLLNLTQVAQGDTAGATGSTPTGKITFSGATQAALYQPLDYSEIENVIANFDPNPKFNAAGLIAGTPVGISNGVSDDFDVTFGGGLVTVTNKNLGVDAFTPVRLPAAGLQSVQIYGSSDSDRLLVDASSAPLAIGFGFFGDGKAASESANADTLELRGGLFTSSITHQPNGPDLGAGVLTLANGKQITVSQVENLELNDFANVTVTPTDSANLYTLSNGMSLSGAEPAILIRGSELAGAGVVDVASAIGSTLALNINLGQFDGANANDTLIVENNVLRNVPELTSFNVSLGNGADRFELEDSDYHLLTLGGGITVDGGSGTDNIVATAQTDAEEVDVAFSLTTSKTVAAAATLSTSSAVFIAGTSVINLLGFNGEQSELYGNNSNNGFNLSGWDRLATATINGGSGSDVLTGLDGATNLWSITNTNKGNVGGFVFDGVESLVGGATANDNFVFTAVGEITGTINASGGNDTLNFSARTSPLQVALLSADTTGHQGSVQVIGSGFLGIDTLIGGVNGADQLIGRDVDQIWSLSGTSTLTRFLRVDENLSGAIDSTDLLIGLNRTPTLAAPTLTFTSFEVLNGGRASDIFQVTGDQAAQISAGLGDDVLQVQDSFSSVVGTFAGGDGHDVLDFRNQTFARVVQLSSGDSTLGFTGTESSITQGFTGVNRVIGSNSVDDEVRGLDRAYDTSSNPIPRPGQWIVNGVNRGSYTDSSTGTVLDFGDFTDTAGVRGFENITGGTDFDSFSFQSQGRLGGSLKGGSHPQGFPPTYDTLIGDNTRAAEQFVIDGVGTGTFQDGATPILGRRFEGIETIVGSAGVDTFTFTNAGSLLGPLDGAGGRDLLVGDNDGNVFTVTGADRGLTGVIGARKANTLEAPQDDFQNIENLSGGSGVDTFLIQGTLVGDLSGQGSTDTFTFTDTGAIFGTLSGGAGTDTLIAGTTAAINNIINVFGTTSSGVAVPAIGRGEYVNKIPLFTDLENITGGDGNDIVSFNNFGSISGTLNGGLGDDTLVGDDDDNFFSVSKANQGALLTKMSLFQSIENLTGGGGNDTFNISANASLGDSTVTGSGKIVGLVGNDTVVVSTGATVFGRVTTGELNDTIDLRGRIVGAVDTGIDADRFVLQAGAAIDGQATGGDGDDLFEIQGAVALGFELRGGNGNDTFAFSIPGSLNQQINGEGGTDVVQGDDDGNVFTINSANAGTLPGHFTDTNVNQDFFDIDGLTGGAAVDTFTIGANLGGTVNGRDGNDTISVAGSVSVGGSLNGEAGNDSISVGAGTAVLPTHVEGNVDAGEGDDIISIGDAVTASATSVIRGAGGVDALTIDYTGSVARSFTVEGGTTTPTATEADSLRLTGTYVGSTTSYTVGANPTAGILTTTGGMSNQTVTFSTTESLSIDNAGGALTINASAKADLINIKDGTLPRTRVEFRTVAAPTIDTATPLTFTRVAGTTVTINGNDGNDTININNPGVTVAANLDVNGGLGDDIINIQANHQGNLNGNGGKDLFVFTNGKKLTGNIVGEDGVDTINASASTTALQVTVQSESANGVGGTETVLLTGTFADIDSITGGTQSDTLTNGLAGGVDWDINTVNHFVATTATLDFSSFELLAGSGGDDRFGITGSRSATISGGGGNDQLIFNNTATLTGPFDGQTGNDTVSFAGTPVGFAKSGTAGTPYAGGRSVALTGGSADGFAGTASGLTNGFLRVESLTGGTGNDSLTGLNIQSTWDLDGTDRYIDDASGLQLAFAAVESLVGRSLVDTFEIKDTVATTRILNGGAGDDLFRFADGTASVNSVTIDGSTESDTVTFEPWMTEVAVPAANYTAVEKVIGGQSSNDSLLGTAAADSFVINDPDSGTLNLSIAFSKLENVLSLGGNDTIQLRNNGKLSGGADGGDGTDILDLSQLPGSVAVVLTSLSGTDGFTGTQAALNTGFSNINTLTGTGTASLQGMNADATWTVGTSESYATTGRSLAFSGFQSLIGGMLADSFNVQQSVTRTLNGREGDDIITIANAVTLTGSPVGGLGNDQFLLGTGSKIVGGINGNTGNDTISFANSSTAVTISLSGAGSSDGFQGTVGGITTGFTNIDTIGGSSATDTLTGRSADSTWDLTGSNTLAAPSNYTDTVLARSLRFFSVENLNGGNQRDTFNVAGPQTANISGGANTDSVNFTNDTARLTGTITGGTESDHLSFAGFTTTAANVTLTGNAPDGFTATASPLVTGNITGIDSLTGGAAADTLTGQNVNATFLIDALGDSYKDNTTVRTLNFAAYENLTGGSQTDTFLIRATLGGNIVGNASGDVVDVQIAGEVGGDITTGDGIDEIFFHKGAKFGSILAPRSIDTGNDADLIQFEFDGTSARGVILQGGAGNDELRLTGGEPLAGDVSQSTFDVGPTSTRGTISTTVNGVEQRISFDGFAATGDYINDRQSVDAMVVNGTTASDTINVVDGLPNFTTVNYAGAFTPISFQNKPKLTVNGRNNTDTITINNPNRGASLNIISADGGTGADAIHVQTDNTGDLIGGEGDDQFVIADGVDLVGETNDVVQGADGFDVLNLGAYTTGTTVTLLSADATGYTGTTSTTIITGPGQFTGIDSLAGTSANDILVGLDEDAIWRLDGANAFVQASSNLTTAFSSFETLFGRTKNDVYRIDGEAVVDIVEAGGDNTFVFQSGNAKITGGIVGSTGSDVLDFSADDVGVSITIDGVTVGDGLHGSVTNVGTIDARISAGFIAVNAVIGGSASDSLTGRNAPSVWEINGTNQYISTETLDFSGIELVNGGTNTDTFNITGLQTINLTGGDGDDSVVFANGAELDGTADGGDPTTAPGDTIDYSLYSTASVITLDGFTNFETLIAGTNSDTLAGSDGDDVFEITGTDAGSINGVAFQNFSNLDGLNGDDSFTFTSDISILSGSINGNAGDDLLSFSGLTSGIDVALTGISLTGGFDGDETGSILDGFASINSVQGGTNNDSFNGLNVDSQWEVNSTGGAYTANGETLLFSDFSTLNGQDSDDAFTVVGDATASISGGDGIDAVSVVDGVTLTGAVDLGLSSDKLSLGEAAKVDGVVTFGDGADQLDLSTTSTNQTITLTKANAATGFDGNLTATPGGITGEFVGLESVIGGQGSDTLQGLDATAAWTIGASSTYTSGNTLTFSAIDNAVGGAEVDTFTLTGDAVINLSGGGKADQFNISSDAGVNGTLDGDDGDDTFTFGSVIDIANTVFDGGDGNDTINFAAGTNAVSLQLDNVSNVEVVQGTNQDDTLVGTSLDDTINVTGADDQGSVGALNFFGFENLFGSTGDDQFVLADGFGVTGAINGEDGADSIDYSAYMTGVTVDLTTGAATNVDDGVTNLENITGGSGNDVLKGDSNNNELVGGQGADTLTDGFGDDVLDGGDGDDVYVLTPGSDDVVTDSLGVDVLDFSLSTGPIVIDLDLPGPQTVLGSHTVDLTGVFEDFVGSPGDDRVTGQDIGTPRAINGNGGNDTFLIGSNSANLWNITSTNQGDVGDITFEQVENLVGGTDDDSFVFADAAVLSGNVDGGDQVTGDEVNYSAYTSAVTIQLSQLLNIELATGSATSGEDVLLASTATDFVINGSDAGTVGSLAFQGIENLTGSSSVDNFTFEATGLLTGTVGVNGNGGVDVLTTSSNDDQITITSPATTGFAGLVSAVSSFTNIGSINGGDGDDTLTGDDELAGWGVDGTNEYTSNGRTVSFSEIENLVGGSADDTFSVSDSQTVDLEGAGGNDIFSLANGSDLTGVIDGGSGSDQLTFVGASGRSITLQGGGATDGFFGVAHEGALVQVPNFTNIDVINGGTGSDTLTGTGAAAVFTLNPLGNSYQDVNGTLGFSSINDLVGSDNADTFNISGLQTVNIQANGGDDAILLLTANASVNGSINGGSGTDDRLDYSALSSAVTGSIAGLTGIERIVGGTEAGDTLNGAVAGSNWAVTGTNSGTVDSIIFTGWEQLAGANGSDVFDVANGGSVVSISGGNGSDTLDLGDVTTARNITLSSVGLAGFGGTDANGVVPTFSGIDTLIGSTTASDTLTGISADSAWALNSTVTNQVYTTSSTNLNFRSFETLRGGSLADTFTITGTLSLALSGGDGNDRFNFRSGTVLTGSVAGGAGVDIIDTTNVTTAQAFVITAAGTTNGFNFSSFSNLVGTASDIDSVLSGSGADTLRGLNVASTWTTGTSHAYAASSRTLGYSGIESRFGGTNVDTYNLQGNAITQAVNTFNGGSGGDIFNLNFAAGTSVASGVTLTVQGSSSAATLVNADTVNVNINGTNNGARNLGVTYSSTTAGNVRLTGLGGSGGALTLQTIERLNINGDAANNDSVTISGTGSADLFTVTPTVNGASVLLNGGGKGVAGGSVGPDITVSGIATTGFTISGANPTSVPGDTLAFGGTGSLTLSSLTSGAIQQSGVVTVNFNSFEDLDPLNPITFNINALTQAGNNSDDLYDVALIGGRINVDVNGANVLNEDTADVAALVINGSNDNDQLSVDFSGGNPVPTGGITFNGSGQSIADTLTVTGAGANVATYTANATTNGTGVVTVDGSAVNLVGVEPLAFTGLSKLSVVTPNASDTIAVTSPAAGFNQIAGTSGPITLSSVLFSGVTSVSIDGATNGGTGSDSVTFTGDLVATGLTSLNVATGNGADTVNGAAVTTLGLSISTNDGADQITGGGGSDTINAGNGTDTIHQTASGTQVLTDTQLTGAGTDSLTGVEAAVLAGGTGADTINASAFTGSATLSGNDGDDTITGGNGLTVISGGNGADSLTGGSNNDTITGDAGTDVIDGGAGADSLDGGSGNDTITGGAGNDILVGGSDVDTILEVGTSPIVITNTSLSGNGSDTLSGFELAFLTLTSTGGSSIDATGFTASQGTTLRGSAGKDTILGSGAADNINGFGDNDSIVAGEGADNITGGAGDDIINAGGGDDTVRGNAGDDQITGGLGSDSLEGGDGTDRLVESADVNFTLTDTTLVGVGSDVFNTIEQAVLVGGSSANTILATGFSGSTTLSGGSGDDSIVGGSGVDLILGGLGNDTINGSGGNDFLNGNAGNDSVIGGDGTDTVTIEVVDGNITVTNTSAVGDGTDTLVTIEQAVLNGGTGNNVLSAAGSTLNTTLNGGAGNDTLIGGLGDDIYIGTDYRPSDTPAVRALKDAEVDSISVSGSNIVLTNTTFTANSGKDQLISIESVTLRGSAAANVLDASGYTLGSVVLIGGIGNDTLIGGSGADSITGGAGNDTIVGNGGNDSLVGDAGLDTLRGGDGNDYLNGGDDADTIFGDAGADQITGGAGNDTIEAGTGTDTINGNAGNDTIRAGADDDLIDGGTGNDMLFGEDGNDTIYGQEGDDGINAGAGNDNVIGHSGRDTILGGAGNDTMNGAGDDDTIIGGDGDDKLTGGSGLDKMAGNAGTDIFVSATVGEIDEAFMESLFPALI